MKREVLYFLQLLGIFAYLLAPKELPPYIVIISFILFVILTGYIMIQDTKSYGIMSFNNLFLPMLMLCTFFIPIFSLISPWDSSGQTAIFHVEYESKGLAIVMIGLCSYLIGYNSPKNGNLRASYNMSDDKSFNAENRGQIRILKSIMFVVTCCFSYYATNTSFSSNDIDGIYVAMIVPSFSLTLMLSTIQNKCDSLTGFLSKNAFLLFQFAYVISFMILLGDRTLPLTLSLIILFIFNKYVKTIPIRFFLTIFISVFFLFSAISQNRSSETGLRNVSATELINSSSSIIPTSPDEWITTFQDILPANAIVSIAPKYVESSGYFFPLRIIAYILSPIPFLPSVIMESLFGVSILECSSAECLTQYNRSYLAFDSISGIGTHVVSDIYVSWGILGVIIAFYLFGRLIDYSQKNSNVRIFAIITLILFSSSIYMPRATIYTEFRSIVWAILLYKLSKSLSR